ncbi:MAG: tetratricopeptide repeat protein [Myxococcota bacterium]|nr:tetratricopeptide repeat protein [Myxococcota bacterium]MDW8363875.1 tetratricopeptide repeat protein [Myxococcales bacterium]
MSWWSRLWRRASVAQCLERGEALARESRWVEARDAFEEAARAADATDAQREQARSRARACTEALVDGYLEQARRASDAGRLEEAREALGHALQIADDPTLRERIEHAGLALDVREALAFRAERAREPTDEERFEALAGGWEERQAEQYAALGEPFRAAMLDVLHERFESARERLEAIVAAAGPEPPLYLLYELGKVRLACGDTDGGENALRAFLERLPEDEGDQARLEARVELARLCDERGDEDGALAQLEALTETMPDHPHAHLALGRYLRQRGHFDEACEVLRGALVAMDEARPDWRLLVELGLALRDAGHTDEALRTLERVVHDFVTRADVAGMPPEAVIPLAELHERVGGLARAAGLWSTLARGRDPSVHFRAHLEAGRLLAGLGLRDEARRMLERAVALAPDEASRDGVHARLRELESVTS